MLETGYGVRAYTTFNRYVDYAKTAGTGFSIVTRYTAAMPPDAPTDEVRPRRFRKLRIAWSMWWGVVAVLLCVLWVRSYSWWDEWYTPTSIERYSSPSSNSGIVIAESASGRAIVYFATGTGTWIWHISEDLKGTYWAGREAAEQSRYQGFAGFAIYKTHGIYRTLRVPHWFLVFAATCLAGASWLRWSYRFSLRTLLIATTLVAVGLGFIVWIYRT